MLTLAQLYDLGQNVNIDIFGGISLPTNSPINRTNLINAIMEHCGLNYPVYADPYVMASAVTLWSAKNQYTFEHIGKILTAEYSPIENTDRYEDITVTHDRDLNDNTKGNNSKNEYINSTSEYGKHGYNAEAHSGTDTDTTENTTSAYNSNTYQPDSKTVDSLLHGEEINGSNQEEGNTIANQTKNTSNNIINDKNVKENEKTRTINHTHGNIGVMSNQTMLTEEYTLMGKFNPYTFLAGLFENDLTVFVY